MSSLAWLDFDEAERQRAQRIMALFQERESRDELGLGAIRDSIADHLFPGTSTIQTRLRYMLFIPWLFRILESPDAPENQIRADARSLEIRLANALKKGGESNGIIGRDAGPRLQRLPSSVYWAGLGAWGTVARLGGVRDAFNSPFRPFVLATTSVGQEGLDFHPYCYRVHHWNLPSNPVDLEQREGRVHRFKGHAVRLNLAERQATIILGTGRALDDPWALMFEQARLEAATDTDLIPYWIYEGSVRVERRVPMLPFSREVTRLAWLKRSLTVYRLAFGQPRQDDLLDYLQTLAAVGMSPAELADLQIRLEPKALGS